MKVILLSDVKKVGKKGSIVEVSDGYGANYLIPNKLAVKVTKTSMDGPCLGRWGGGHRQSNLV